MSMKVKNNLGAIRTLNTLGKNAGAVQKNLRKVATGEKINSAADNASAYSISERMREKIRSLDQANQNTQNDMAMMRTAEGAVANIVDTLRTLKQKAIDSANDSNTDEDRRIMQKEVDQFIDQIDDNALVTFNGKQLVNGRMSSANVFTRSVFFNPYLHNDQIISEFSSPRPHAWEAVYMNDKPTWMTGESIGIEKGDLFKSTFVMGGKTIIMTGCVDNYSLLALLGGAGYLSTGSNHVIYINGTSAGGGLMPAGVYGTDKYADTFFSFPHGAVLGGSTMHGGRGAIEYDGGVNDPSGHLLYSPGKMSGIAITSESERFDEQLTGVSYIIMDSSGNIKEQPTRVLNQFTIIQYAQNGPLPYDVKNGLAAPKSTAMSFHVGAGANQSMAVGLRDMRSVALGIKNTDGTKLSISTRDAALAAIPAFDNAINSALDQMTSIGAMEARLEYTAANLTTSTENVQSSESTIRDADMAREMTNYTKDNVLLQAAQAMLAQANQDTSSVLGLLS